jgi:hypothetical protein
MTLIKLTPQASQTALVLVALSTLVAGCGISSSTSSSASTSASAGLSTGRAKLAACLKQHGITLPAGRGPGAGAPPGGAPGAGSGNPPAGAPGSGTGTNSGGRPPGGFFGGAGSNSRFRDALKACGANFPAGGRRRGFNRQNIQKYLTCVRQHGYNLPNPNFSGNGPVFPANVRTNKKFQSASKACQSLLAPQGAAGPSSA